ncbi:hypothetical protein LCGC14_2147480 [marine sediment metagenome]|uniref:Phage head-tail adaptor n=1 Tax=marine sediment metagenome TaxID=412755 RepID=A0A0F9G9F7_9ZZZZ
MRAPELTHRLLLEAPVDVAHGAGGLMRDWQSLGEVWAELRVRSGRQAKGAGGALERLTWRIRMRASPPDAPSRPVAGQRLREGARIFVIHAVADDPGMARYLTCFAQEETAT